MRVELEPHPDLPAPPGIAVEVEAERRANALLLRYRLLGNRTGLILPGPAEPLRTDGLWRHSCFEAFVQPVGGDGYLELNVSASTQWAAYRFDGYRSGMTELEAEPHIVSTDGGVEVSVDLPAPGPWRVGLSAVIESADGSLSYWALRHPQGRPDFHHRDCFALELAPAS